ncbi:phytanoyl-CoA dioxygenase family protein [Zopfia rhizophila CBS 207.26]|uniref:Phytanoyl-CoA dioxygenase family protein n=1 Tax=Zopfia rhizophila CBS 207.26 TaxID=1314779 RepID=A0A6A6DZP2_9PEZI|nr:phytanoyl-CoA dioxygenase family protein [Zopfia rhizophila CBS 207.26]
MAAAVTVATDPAAAEASNPISTTNGSVAGITNGAEIRYKDALASLERDGFVVLPASLFPSFDLPTLRAAASRTTTLARTGKWPYIRTLPKQFPPWPSDPSQGIWGVQHLLHPDNPDHLTFAKSYFDKELLEQVRNLIGCEQDELIMELYNMLVRPDKDFALRWHRDDIPPTASDEEEMERLGKPGFHAQWNLALYDDASLIVVPGSHKRARTETERNADPYEDNMPGQLVVKLKAGEVAFYNNNILHRGKYDSKVERMTLHGSIGTTKGSSERARNVLQHGVGEWVEKYEFKDFDPEMAKRANIMREMLVEMGKKSGDVGFFSKDE